jgi:hypothetical protein
MTRVVLTFLALIAVAIWLDGVKGGGSLGSTLILIWVFLVVAAMFFCLVGTGGMPS